MYCRSELLETTIGTGHKAARVPGVRQNAQVERELPGIQSMQLLNLMGNREN